MYARARAFAGHGEVTDRVMLPANTRIRYGRAGERLRRACLAIVESDYSDSRRPVLIQLPTTSAVDFNAKSFSRNVARWFSLFVRRPAVVYSSPAESPARRSGHKPPSNSTASYATRLLFSACGCYVRTCRTTLVT